MVTFVTSEGVWTYLKVAAGTESGVWTYLEVAAGTESGVWTYLKVAAATKSGVWTYLKVAAGTESSGSPYLKVAEKLTARDRHGFVPSTRARHRASRRNLGRENMVVRVIDAQSMLSLGVMDSSEGAALAAKVLALARSLGKLPPLLADAVEGVAASEAALSEALLGGLGPAIDQGSEEAPDRVLQASWSATEAWLAGALRLPSKDPHVLIARSLHGALFPDGASFIRGTHERLWSESKRRLEYIVQKKLDGEFKKIGGTAYLAAVTAAHEVFGVSAGITKPKPPVEPSPEVRGKLDALKAALKWYGVQAVAMGNPKDPAAVALSRKLIAPLEEFEGASRNKGGRKPPAPATPAT